MEDLVETQELPKKSVIGGKVIPTVEVGADDVDREVRSENDHERLQDASGSEREKEQGEKGPESGNSQVGEHVAVEAIFVRTDSPALEHEVSDEVGKSESEKDLEWNHEVYFKPLLLRVPGGW